MEEEEGTELLERLKAESEQGCRSADVYVLLPGLDQLR